MMHNAPPRAYFVGESHLTPNIWFLDSEALHQVTNVLNTLSLHSGYDDVIVVGNGNGQASYMVVRRPFPPK